MAKGGKSSATSATRKKHAKKGTEQVQEEPSPMKEKRLTKKEKAAKKKEPKIKAYLPPVKPAPIQPDPLETTGLIHSLPPELVIVLRSFNKKAQITKIRALEELQSGWVDKCRGDDDTLTYLLVEMLPVWLHHLPAFFVHASRRIRLLACGIHLSFTRLSPTRQHLVSLLRDFTSLSQNEMLIGTWYLATHDIDKSISAAALNSWLSIFSNKFEEGLLYLDDRYLSVLLAFSQRTVLDPDGMYGHLNPTAPIVPAASPKKGRQSVKIEPDALSRSKAEELEESMPDRKARLRVSGLGAIRSITELFHDGAPEDLVEFFKNFTLWSSLHHAQRCPFTETESFGYGQHNVRKSAWGVVLSLLTIPRGRLEPILPILGVVVLRSAWVEPDTNVQAVMWQPLLKFIKEFPDVWELERAHDYVNDEESMSESEGEDKEKEDAQRNVSTILTRESIAYREFLKSLELGCNGSPTQGYPTVVITLSTIPSAIMESKLSTTPFDDVFVSFWKGLNCRALSSLQQSATSAVFLMSLLECMIFLIKRLRNTGDQHRVMEKDDVKNVIVMSQELATNQVEKVLAHLTDGSLRVEPRAAARSIAQTLLALNDIGADLFEVAWITLSTHLKRLANSHAVLLAAIFKASHDKFKRIPELCDVISTSMSDILITAVQSSSMILGSVGSRADANNHTPVDGVPVLVSMIDQFREGLFDDSKFAKLVDDVVAECALPLLESFPPLLLAYLAHRQNEESCLRLWHALLSGVAQHPEKAARSVGPLFDALRGNTFPRYLKPRFGEIDSLVENLVTQTLAGDTTYLTFLRQVLQSPDYFLSDKGYSSVAETITSALSIKINLALSDAEIPLNSFEPSLSLITPVLQNDPRELPKHDLSHVLPDIFVLAYLLPMCYPSQDDHSTFIIAKASWEQWQITSEPDSTFVVSELIKTRLRAILYDTQLQPFPHDILKMVWSRPPGITFNLPTDIFPSPNEIGVLLNRLPADPIHPSLAVSNALIPPASFIRQSKVAQVVDRRGFSSYARIISALLDVFVKDRALAKQMLWALQHFLTLEIFIQDFISVPSGQSEVFGPEAIHENLDTLISKIEQLSTYILTSSTEGWRAAAIDVLLSKQNLQPTGNLSTFLVNAVERAQKSDSQRDCRVLYSILTHVFNDVDKYEADQWMAFARKVELSAPELSMTIVYTVANLAPEPPRLDRYRNELAASLLAVSPNKANSDGLMTLRRLVATAPNPESDVVFLSQTRALNAAKACQQWLRSDEDLEEEVESTITLIFYFLSPILQDITGSHWDFVFDIIENNLENSSLKDDLTLVTLARTLKLVLLVKDLSATNKSLRASWEERYLPILITIRDLAAISLDDVTATIPRSTCRGLLLSIIQDLPSSLIDQSTIGKMSHLVVDPSVEVQKIAYYFLAIAAKKYTEHLVIEAGVDTEATIHPELPPELLNILEHAAAEDDSVPAPINTFGYLLGWMLLFNLFADSSLKVRTGYIDQLRNLGVVSSRFIPTVLNLLRLDQGPLKTFKLDLWAVDEFYLEYYESSSEFNLSVLAAHLYYRALLTVPSLIHTWVVDCKDRQLSSNITNYTSQCFSPVIIQAELSHVKSHESTSLLVDDSFTIKVTAATNEVAASYAVDEHQLEIKLKIPHDWPLHRMEVKDVKRVGVDENRWRAWILAVQQIIWSQNGRIIDGLSLFKKNVTLHFEGQVECAICYSIISVMDGSLPKKPCRTCKNRFHAGCLYKWFNTSHSSSCPLCRSDIF